MDLLKVVNGLSGPAEGPVALDEEDGIIPVDGNGDNSSHFENESSSVHEHQGTADETGGMEISQNSESEYVSTAVGKNVYASATPCDSPDEFVESMESSEHESTNGELVPRRINQLVQSGESADGGRLAYTQRRNCYKITNRHKLPLCRECLGYNVGRKVKNIICRFSWFRKLISRKSKTGKGQAVVSVFGFCDPIDDPSEDDIRPWLASPDCAPTGLDLELSQHLITQLGDQLCGLLQQERETLEIQKELGKEGKIYWKKMVDQVREMCDVCATTVFNYHWTCDKCGFMVCPECFKARRAAGEKEQNENAIKHMRDEYKWLLCTNHLKNVHKPELLSLTQIIPQKALESILQTLHEVRKKWNIPENCGCADSAMNGESSHMCATPVKVIPPCPTETRINSMAEDAPPNKKRKTSEMEKDSQEADADDGSNSDSKLSSSDHRSPIINDTLPANDESDSSDEEAGSFLESLLEPGKSESLNGSCNKTENGCKSEKQNGSSCQVETKDAIKQTGETPQNNFVDVESKSYFEKAMALVEVKVCTHAETKNLYPNLKHVWLCSGTLLNLLDPDDDNNYKLFKDLWVRGQPVIVSNVGHKLSRNKWTPEAFNKDCGDSKNDLVNCMTGKIVPAQMLSSFWEGFEDVSKRLKDDDGVPMLLKLKDWPAGEDFATFLPDRFEDLMSALPLKEYTHRTGRLNLAARLPSNFMKPDLGPKMYIAYGDGNHLEKGTTNLHLDISDAVNVMVHVGVPKNCNVKGHNKAVNDAIEQSDCDELTVRRVRQGPDLPGALWHIYRPWDAAKIRDLINKVSVERGHAIEPNHDPIHDQVVYLDKDLRHRLREEYNVNGFPIVQCEGDAVFIPAGAPHQVRNLHNCIKIAEDFVSPENVRHCFQLTEEFRNLSETHSNHEDKLQIKNIVYHAVKDALSVLLHQLHEQVPK